MRSNIMKPAKFSQPKQFYQPRQANHSTKIVVVVCTSCKIYNWQCCYNIKEHPTSQIVPYDLMSVGYNIVIIIEIGEKTGKNYISKK